MVAGSSPARRAIGRNGTKRRAGRQVSTVVGVAQLVEPQIVDLVVVGSNPIVHPTLTRRARKLWQYCTPTGWRSVQRHTHTGPLAQLGRAVDS